MELKKTKKQVDGKTYITFWLLENKCKVAIKPVFEKDYQKLKNMCDLLDYE